MDEWRGRRSRPPNVAGGVRGGTQNCRRHLHQQHQQQQQQKQQQQQLFAGNFFTEIRTTPKSERFFVRFSLV